MSLSLQQLSLRGGSGLEIGVRKLARRTTRVENIVGFGRQLGPRDEGHTRYGGGCQDEGEETNRRRLRSTNASDYQDGWPTEHRDNTGGETEFSWGRQAGLRYAQAEVAVNRFSGLNGMIHCLSCR